MPTVIDANGVGSLPAFADQPSKYASDVAEGLRGPFVAIPAVVSELDCPSGACAGRHPVLFVTCYAEEPLDEMGGFLQLRRRSRPSNLATLHDESMGSKSERALYTLLDQQDRHVAVQGEPRKPLHQLLTYCRCQPFERLVEQ